MNVVCLLYEKTLKLSMLDKKDDEKEAIELKKIQNHYVDKTTVIMKNTQFKVEFVFVDVWGKESNSPKQKTDIDNFFAKMM